jgi:hypothetical protein
VLNVRVRWCCRSPRIRCPHWPLADIDNRFGALVGVPRAFGGHSSRPLRASKLSSALWSKTLARCLAFSSGHTSTVDSVPSGSIRMTCHPKDLASYRSRFILRICAQTRRFSSPERRHQTDPLPPLPRWGSSRCARRRQAYHRPEDCSARAANRGMLRAKQELICSFNPP